MRTASVGQKCPDCAKPAKGARVITADQLGAEKRRTAPFSYAVIGIVVVLYVAERFIPGVAEFIRPRFAQANLAVEAGQWWRLLTATLLHAGLWHVGFNMWALSIFGPPLERDVGTVPFGGLYVAGGLAGGALFYVLTPGGRAVGASGAIFALFGAWLAMSYRDRRTVHGRANLQQLLLLLGINLAISFLPGIAWSAHLGGLVAGAGIMLAWMSLGERGPLARLAIAAAVGLASLAAVFLVDAGALLRLFGG
jgi:membrane associated rhomboid family serine protease